MNFKDDPVVEHRMYHYITVNDLDNTIIIKTYFNPEVYSQAWNAHQDLKWEVFHRQVYSNRTYRFRFDTTNEKYNGPPRLYNKCEKYLETSMFIEESD